MVYPALSTSVYRLSEFEPAAFCWWDLKSLILHRNRSWHQSNPDPRCNSCFFVLGVRKSSRCGMVYADTGTDTYTATFIFAQEATLLTLVSKSFFTPNAPFFVLFPVASAVPAAAESVTPLVAEKVVAMVA